MKKILSLIKATMTDNMSIIKIKQKNKSELSKKLFPIILFVMLFFIVFCYADMLMEELNKNGMTFVGITLFIFLTTILTLVEGVYKSSSLLFNCKDDNLLLSLPIKKETVFFIRVFKFYVFELMYNSMLLVPSMLAYLRYVKVDVTYFIVSILAILLIPMIPIVLSCIIGIIISSISSKFKKKNIAQIIVTTIILLGIMYLSFNMDSLMAKLAENATSINDFITKLYFPAGLYINLITAFNIKDLILFIVSNIAIFALSMFILSKFYFKINSGVKSVKIGKKSKKYKITENKPFNALIKKELNRFITSPVFVTNAAFGLALYIVGCIICAIRYDFVSNVLYSELGISLDKVDSYIPLILLCFIIFSSLTTFITSSMISLEGRTFNILKSLPVKAYTIINAKIMAAVLVMVICLLIGDVIIFSKFSFNIFEIIIILLASIILPLVTETIGIIVNLKYPNMKGLNDAEVVKQSSSSMISVFIGFFLIGLSFFFIFSLVNIGIDLIMFITLLIYIIIYVILHIYLNKKGSKLFNDIIV